MSELYTIKPDGGGDYTTLQAFEDAQDGSMTGRGIVTAECYDGTAELGQVTFDGWSNEDSSNYVRVFVPLDERHDGTKGSDGAWLQSDTNWDAGVKVVGCDYCRIEGLRIVGRTANGGVCCVEVTSDNVTVDSNLLEDSPTAGLGAAIQFGTLGVHSVSGGVIKNNLVYAGGTKMSRGIELRTGEGYTTSADVYNNTIDEVVAYTAYGIHLNEYGGKASGTINATVKNNIVTNCDTDYYRAGTSGTVTADYNCSEDATGDDWGGTHNLINQTPSDLFVTVGSDHTLKTGSNAIDAGTTISGWDNDAIHIESDNWRPRGSGWDMGALELTGSAPSGYSNKVCGVASANLSKVNGVAKADIEKVNQI